MKSPKYTYQFIARDYVMSPSPDYTTSRRQVNITVIASTEKGALKLAKKAAKRDEYTLDSVTAL